MRRREVIAGIASAAVAWPHALIAQGPERLRRVGVLIQGDTYSVGVDGLRELAAGIHPEILTSRGLAAAIEGLVERLPMPVDTHELAEGRVAQEIEASVYFLVSEALTNVIKHAKAQSARVRLAIDPDVLTVEVSDDGVGGAHADPGGSGLTGLSDRIGALDGTLSVDSRAGSGTTLRAVVPLA